MTDHDILMPHEHYPTPPSPMIVACPPNCPYDGDDRKDMYRGGRKLIWHGRFLEDGRYYFDGNGVVRKYLYTSGGYEGWEDVVTGKAVALDDRTPPPYAAATEMDAEAQRMALPIPEPAFAVAFVDFADEEVLTGETAAEREAKANIEANLAAEWLAELLIEAGMHPGAVSEHLDYIATALKPRLEHAYGYLSGDVLVHVYHRHGVLLPESTGHYTALRLSGGPWKRDRSRERAPQ